ncbi:MAG TPA: ATP synthase F1 subunit delta [Bryobacteraceae bacterium]|jgi:F-type H+-transporting ATPase subunit delta
MTLSAVATRYANALADVVTASGSALKPQDAVTQLHSFASTLQSSEELHNALITPAVPNSRKKAVVGRIVDILKLSPIARNFLFVLVDHRRISLLAEVIHIFERVVDERLGFVRAEVASAGALNDQQRAALTAEFERLTGKRIRMRFTVEESLIGGVVAHIGSTVYDGSVRGRLASLEQRLGAEV